MLSSRVRQSSAPPSIKSQVDLDSCSRAWALKSVKHTKGISGPLKEKPKLTKQNPIRILPIQRRGWRQGGLQHEALWIQREPPVTFISKEVLPKMLIPSPKAGSHAAPLHCPKPLSQSWLLGLLNIPQVCPLISRPTASDLGEALPPPIRLLQKFLIFVS